MREIDHPLEPLVSQYFKVHPVNPQRRLLQRAATSSAAAESSFIRPIRAMRSDGTSATRQRSSKIRWIRQTRARPRLHSGLPRSVGDRRLMPASTTGNIDCSRAHTPGPYTFILRATHEVAEAPARPEAPLDRHSRARPRDRASPARGSGRAPHELDAAAARRSLPLTEPEEIRDAARQARRRDSSTAAPCGRRADLVLDFSREASSRSLAQGQRRRCRRSKLDRAATSIRARIMSRCSAIDLPRLSTESSRVALIPGIFAITLHEVAARLGRPSDCGDPDGLHARPAYAESAQARRPARHRCRAARDCCFLTGGQWLSAGRSPCRSPFATCAIRGATWCSWLPPGRSRTSRWPRAGRCFRRRSYGLVGRRTALPYWVLNICSVRDANQCDIGCF